MDKYNELKLEIFESAEDGLITTSEKSKLLKILETTNPFRDYKSESLKRKIDEKVNKLNEKTEFINKFGKELYKGQESAKFATDDVNKVNNHGSSTKAAGISEERYNRSRKTSEDFERRKDKLRELLKEREKLVKEIEELRREYKKQKKE